MAKRGTRLIGTSQLYDVERDQTLTNTVALDRDPDQVTTRIGPIDDRAVGRAVTSRHPAVLAFRDREIAAVRAYGHATRPVRPFFKAAPEPGVPEPCVTCGGTGEVTRGRDEHARLVPCPACGG